jgi:peptide-methionine (R)-S-oxide reductase
MISCAVIAQSMTRSVVRCRSLVQTPAASRQHSGWGCPEVLGVCAGKWVGVLDQKFAVTKTDEEWRKTLTPQQFAVLRGHATEAPGSCALLSEHRAGKFSCAGCGQTLFVAERKFESGTGWPSFYAPLEGSIGTTEDRSFGMTRTEVHCSQCGGHLGHVFPDGPPPTGLRYCINGVALVFTPEPQREHL